MALSLTGRLCFVRPKENLVSLSTPILNPRFSRSLPLLSCSNHNVRGLRPAWPKSRVSAISASTEGSSSTGSEDIATLLEGVEVYDLNGNAVPITNLWKERKAVIAFARHFGCVLCRRRAAFLASKKEIMDASNVALVLIGPGSVDQAGKSIIQSYLEGFRQDWGLSFEKDTVARGGWQQGGIVVAGPGKSKITYMHKDKEAGDDPPIEDILKACCMPQFAQ
ncbi:thioredoxin-like protein AAED1, chloroplastic isoform X2 [Amborella trichopoda]|uniref:thioredoxin-like protein AAED1, chloroplastic isoform X2 n=1 Tax=Amborella trichopoda TaxID=13333 RepID=UPI0009BD0CC6|nr:thioredoxin-like protein AAED1, chloroplastic isoform X2 [Amborella trichopoda]|eukprot:XP_020522952.1 thioredoxin-like protein AAED1, chloroplastic isoform X2 [Amborella trichopoda]